MEIIIIWFGLSFIAGYVASNKGRSGAGYFFLSLLLSPLIGLIAALVVKDDSEKVANNDLKKCLHCAELVKKEAVKCKHCGGELYNNA